MLQKDPVLIFDEPTNHLDLESVTALGEGLSHVPRHAPGRLTTAT